MFFKFLIFAFLALQVFAIEATDSNGVKHQINGTRTYCGFDNLIECNKNQVCLLDKCHSKPLVISVSVITGLALLLVAVGCCILCCSAFGASCGSFCGTLRRDRYPKSNIYVDRPHQHFQRNQMSRPQNVYKDNRADF